MDVLQTMDVMLGYTFDLGGRWAKADIRLDESDLTAFLSEYDVPVTQKLTVNQKYKILVLMAEKLLLVNQISSYPDHLNTAENRDALNRKATELAKLGESLQERAGLV